MKKHSFIFIFISLFISNLNHAQWTWTGSSNSDWNNTANWSPSSVPASGATVWINNSTYDPIISSNINLKAIIVEENAELEIEFGSTLTFISYVTFASIENYGTVTNNGTIDIDGDGTGEIENGIYNEGIFYNNAFSAGAGGRIKIDNLDGIGIYINGGGKFYNNGGII
ncbi:MAG: hypothetical protein AAF573_06030, partial [Bacteroidota bacterium]